MKKTKVDREKTRRLNSLVSSGIQEVLLHGDQKQMLINLMQEQFDIAEEELQIVLNTYKVDDLKLSLRYMILESLYKITQNEDYFLDMFYNTEVKLRFLHKYPTATQVPYARIFEKSKALEEKNEKDLAEFPIIEMEKILKLLKPLTESASHVNGRIITAYVEWCLENNETSAKENELKRRDAEYFSKFVNKELKLYFSRREIEDIVWDCVNAQDAIIIKLLFEGVQGKSLSEIRNIKKEHVLSAEKDNNILIVLDEDNNKRRIQLEESTIKLLKDAMNEPDYYKKNNAVEDKGVGLKTNLVDNDYVIRTSLTRTDKENRPVDKMVIYRRLKTISEFEGDPSLTAKNIVRSGAIYQAYKKLKSKDELTKEDFIDICARYNMENWYPVKKYCNNEVIEKLYPNDYVDNTDINSI